jgi:nudix-type nucleoside diphosphatase (YffH/AdpP family)
VIPPAILGEDVVHRGYLTVRRLRVRGADGAEAVREVESHGDAIAVLPYDAGRRAALVVRLFRPPVLDAAGEPWLEEACAGMVEGGDSAQATVRREAQEELGVEPHDLEPVARTWSSPGVSTERIALFLAPYDAAARTGPGGGLEAEHEAITVVERPLADLAAEADTGLIADAKLLMLVLALRLRRPELFV